MVFAFSRSLSSLTAPIYDQKLLRVIKRVLIHSFSAADHHHKCEKSAKGTAGVRDGRCRVVAVWQSRFLQLKILHPIKFLKNKAIGGNLF